MIGAGVGPGAAVGALGDGEGFDVGLVQGEELTVARGEGLATDGDAVDMGSSMVTAPLPLGPSTVTSTSRTPEPANTTPVMFSARKT